jgi:O-antigen/teichoic acid export membrane protein
MTEKRTGWRKLLKGSAIVLTVKVLGALGGLGFAYIVVQEQGSAAFGLAEFLLTLVTVIAVLGRLGLDAAVVRFFAAFAEQGRWAAIRLAIRWAGLRVLLATTILGSIAWGLWSFWAAGFDENFEQVMPWLLPASVLFALAGFAAESLRGLQKMFPYALLQPGPMMGLAAGLFLLWPGGLSAVDALGLAACVWGVVGVVWIAIALGRLPREAAATSDQRKPLEEIWQAARPMWLSGGLYLVMSWTDALMVGHFMTAEDLGVYRFVFRLAALVAFSQFAINAIAAPNFGALHASRDWDGLRTAAHRIGWLNMAFSSAVLLAVLLAAPWITAYFGQEFSSDDAWISLALLALSQWINVICSPVMYLNMTGRERVVTRIMAIFALLNVALNLWLIPEIGMAGAALATVVGSALWNTAAVAYIRRADGFVLIPLLDLIRRKNAGK